MKENYENVKILFNGVNLNAIKMQLSFDLKMANIVLGLQSHSAMYSCYICDAKNPKKRGIDWEKVDGENVDGEKVKFRTLGSIRENATKWRDAGADLNQAKVMFQFLV